MIVFVILYTIVWVFITAMFYFLGKVRLDDPFSKKTMLFMILHLTAMVAFFLCVFYSPWRRGLMKAGDDAKKKYESLKEDTEEVYQNQIKVFWINALNEQNRYYLFSLMAITLLPFFYFFFYITNHTVPEIDTFLNDSFSFILLTISVFYTSLLLFIYTLCHEKVFMILPFLLFLFLGGILYFQKPFPFFTTVGFICLCLVESILVLKNVAFYWCLIPLVPFYFALYVLYTQQ
jgi:hypothetical protein